MAIRDDYNEREQGNARIFSPGAGQDAAKAARPEQMDKTPSPAGGSSGGLDAAVHPSTLRERFEWREKELRAELHQLSDNRERAYRLGLLDISVSELARLLSIWP